MTNPFNDFEKLTGHNSPKMSVSKEDWATTQQKLKKDLYGDLEKSTPMNKLTELMHRFPVGKRFPININGDFTQNSSSHYFLEVTEYKLNNDDPKNNIAHLKINIDESSKTYIKYNVPMSIFLEGDVEKKLKNLMNCTVAAAADTLLKRNKSNLFPVNQSLKSPKTVSINAAQEFVKQISSKSLASGLIKKETINTGVTLHFHSESSQITLCLNQNGFWVLNNGSGTEKDESNESIIQ